MNRTFIQVSLIYFYSASFTHFHYCDLSTHLLHYVNHVFSFMVFLLQILIQDHTMISSKICSQYGIRAGWKLARLLLRIRFLISCIFCFLFLFIDSINSSIVEGSNTKEKCWRYFRFFPTQLAELSFSEPKYEEGLTVPWRKNVCAILIFSQLNEQNNQNQNMKRDLLSCV